MFVKFCGFTKPEDVEAACSLGISACGFIFYQQSKRFCNPSDAVQCIATCKKHGVMSVGVFVDNDPLSILSLAGAIKLDTIQIYTIDLYYELSPHYSIIFALRIGKNFSFNTIPIIHTKDRYLFDTYDLASFGGTGKPFDWNSIAGFNQMGRTIIAGGLNSSTIPMLCSVVQPFGIDISTGIEDKPGIKNINKMHAIIQTIKELGYDISR
ncbi:MAG TPA: phosphoribosylanthranilate isomerase [Spirochaetota bacterium]|nr:phosphoribosylanthranilate isomerase [Spirochaetota bacterium]HOM87387.1 phosphoribosylanthranilate isomerase [Spirochaetota bacterium]HPK43380.1 phosphoribosylanthranilate isomerase [Spirochaetota bacterium]HQI38586.1 phosphoribosylanthranilate isomerase [Spirochaetota bacterium]HQK07650.1 phosphoribosylanthranilate isomerase [Spirochaetota bacterium]